MKRNEILKSVGFSDNFLKALDDYEKLVPDVNYQAPVEESSQIFNVVDTSDSLVINFQDDNHNTNVIIHN